MHAALLHDSEYGDQANLILALKLRAPKVFIEYRLANDKIFMEDPQGTN
jgi:hypothetical protein